MFKFKNISSDIMKIVTEEENFIKRAAHKFETLEIEGKDGAIYNELGYLNVEENMKIQILDINIIDNVLGWLNGKGIFEFNGRITNACFYSELAIERSSIIKIANVNFIRDPFWYKKDDQFVTVVDNVENQGNIYSKPIIRLEKNVASTVDVTIAGIRFKYTFPTNENYVEIDCEEIKATYDNSYRNRNLTIDFKFPVLEPGNNIIIKHAGDPIIKIKRKDRWL